MEVTLIILTLNGCPLNTTRFKTIRSGVQDSKVPVATKVRDVLGFSRKHKTGAGGN